MVIVNVRIVLAFFLCSLEDAVCHYYYTELEYSTLHAKGDMEQGLED